MTTANITIVDQYNWFAGQINSIVEVKPKNFNEYFNLDVLSDDVSGVMVPRNMFTFSSSPSSCSAFDVLRKWGVEILDSGDLPDNMPSELEKSGDQLEIYTRRYNGSCQTGKDLSFDNYTYTIPNTATCFNFSNSSLFYDNVTAVPEDYTGFFDPVVGVGGVITCAEGPDPLYYYVNIKSRMKPHATRINNLVEISKSKNIISPFEFDKQRVVATQCGFVSPIYGPTINHTGIYSGVLFDSRSHLIQNFSHRNLAEANQGVNSYIWHDDYFIPNRNHDLYGSSFDIDHPILRNRHLIKNKNLYKLLPYYFGGFEWISIEGIKNKADEFNIPFVFRRTASSYKFKEFDFDIGTSPIEYMVPFSFTGTGSGNICTTTEPYSIPVTIHSGILSDGSLSYNTSQAQIQTEGSYGENVFSSIFWVPDIHPNESGFFSIISGITSSLSFENAAGYIPWVYKAFDFVFSEEGNWCVPDSISINLSNRPLIHNIEADPNSKLYRYDAIKTNLTGGGLISTPPIFGGTTLPVINRPPFSHAISGGVTCGTIMPAFRWRNNITKAAIVPVFEIDTDDSYKEQIMYSTAGLNPKNCLIQDYSTVGKVSKIFIKKLGKFKYSFPAAAEGIGLSLMKTYGVGGLTVSNVDASIFQNLGNDYSLNVPGPSETSVEICSQNSQQLDHNIFLAQPRGFQFPHVSTIPEIDLNYFSKEISIDTENNPVFIKNFTGNGTVVDMDTDPNGENGGVYRLAFFIKDTASAD